MGTSREPVDVSRFDRDDIEDAYGEWDDNFRNDLEVRYDRLRTFNETLDVSTDEDTIEMTERTKNKFKRGTIELVANQIYNRLTTLFNNNRKRLGIHKGEPIADPIRNYNDFKLADNGALTYVDKRTVIDLGNISDGIKPPWRIRKLGVKRLRLMGFMDIMDEDINPYKSRYKKAREKIRKLDENLDERSKSVKSSSTTDAEMIEVTSKDIEEIRTWGFWCSFRPLLHHTLICTQQP